MKTRQIVLAVAMILSWSAASAQSTIGPAARQRAWDGSVASSRLLAVAAEDSILATEVALSVPERIGGWARRFAAADSVVYLFGLRPGGYVATGSLIDDRRQDCVSLLYRVSELARAQDAQDAVNWALRTRFAGADSTVIMGDGRVDYDHPAHLDFSLDMIRTGLWGQDISLDLSGARLDTVGSSRYAAGSFRYVPSEALVPAELAEGDVVWFVLDPTRKKGAQLRQEYGLVIGHIGLIVMEGDEPQLIHAAVSGLSGLYAGGTVVTVPLAVYLARVEKFSGIIVTRFSTTR